VTASQNGSSARRTGVHFYRFVAALAFAVVFGIFSGSLNANAAEAAGARRPNFLMIMCDQLNTFTMGVAGCDVKTPNTDQLAKEGTWFRNAVCAYPLCVPSRISMAVGVYPHQRDYFGNNGGGRSPEVRAKFAGRNEGYPLLWQYFSEAGYRCGYAGKWHVPVDPDDPSQSGFEHLGAGSMSKRTEELAERIQLHGGEQPFFYTISYDIPHQICGWARSQTTESHREDTQPPPPDRCPSLPENFAQPDRMPEALLIEKEIGANIAYPTADWTPDDWRQYLWAYRMFTEGLDRYVGQLTQAVADSPQAENTIIVFISDHGDGAAAHHWNQKTALWEECIRVPFIIRAWGAKGVVDEHPVSSGIDLIPTLLELADLEVPGYLQGQSLAPVVRGRPAQLREYTVTETAVGRTQGRSLRTARYEYVVYQRSKNGQQFFDLKDDPGETKNLIGHADFADAIARHRNLLSAWCHQTNDDFEIPHE
jgi:arylsulfatase A-like enzyme